MPNLPAPTALIEQSSIEFVNAATILDNGSGDIYNIGAPAEVPRYTEGNQGEVKNFVKYGVTYPTGYRVTGVEPKLIYPANISPAAIALARAKSNSAQSVAVPIQIGPMLIEAETMDIGGTNVDGDSIADDLAGWQAYAWSGSTDVESVSAVPFANTPTAGQFGQGAGKNFKFNAADVGKQFLAFAPSRGTQAIVEATETPINSVYVYIEYVLTDGRILVIDAPSCKPIPIGGDLIGGDNVAVEFLFTRNPALCSLGPRIYFKGNSDLFLELC